MKKQFGEQSISCIIIAKSNSCAVIIKEGMRQPYRLKTSVERLQT